jgi:hypothetical protein
MTMMKDGVKHLEKEEQIEVLDVSEILARAVKQ